MAETVTTIRGLPKYMQEYDEALLQQIFGSPDSEGVLQGGLISDPNLFQIPEYMTAERDPLQTATLDMFRTPMERAQFLNRYQPYFTGPDGQPLYLGEGADAIRSGIGAIEGAQGMIGTAQDYIDRGVGGIDAAGIYGGEFGPARNLLAGSMGSFDAAGRGAELFAPAMAAYGRGAGDYQVDTSGFDAARGAIQGGMGTRDVTSGLMDRGRQMVEGAQGQYGVTGGIGDAMSRIYEAGEGKYDVREDKFDQARQNILGSVGGAFQPTEGAFESARDEMRGAGQGEFGAADRFDERTGRAFQMAEEGLGRFDPSTAAQSFMNPYQEQVVDAAMERIDREAAKQRASDAARAVQAGAFGGSRAGVQAAETSRAVLDTKRDTIANLMSQGYDKAMANAIATDEAARKRALQASGVTGQLGAQGVSMEQAAFEDAKRRGLTSAQSMADLTKSEQDMLMRSYQDAQRLGLGAAQSAGDLTRAEEQFRQQAAEIAAGRGLTAATSAGSLATQEENIRRQAYEDAKSRGLTGAQLMNAADQAVENFRSQAYESGATRNLQGGQQLGGLAEAEQRLGLSAFEGGRGRDVSIGSGLSGIGSTQLGTEASSLENQQRRIQSAADQYRAMGLSSADAQMRAQQDEYQRNLEAGRLTGGLGQTYAGMGEAIMGGGRALGALGATSADIGRVYAGMQPADAAFMYDLGEKDRQYRQSLIDAQRSNVLATTQQALAPYSYAQNFLTQSPSASMYSAFSTQPGAAQTDPFMGGVGAYYAMQGMNQG